MAAQVCRDPQRTLELARSGAGAAAAVAQGGAFASFPPSPRRIPGSRMSASQSPSRDTSKPYCCAAVHGRMKALGREERAPASPRIGKAMLLCAHFAAGDLGRLDQLVALVVPQERLDHSVAA